MFPFVLVLCGLGATAAKMAWTVSAGAGAFFGVLFLVVLGLLWAQMRLCRIVLLPDSISFPEWRDEDATESGIAYVALRSVPRGRPDAVSVVLAEEVRDWALDQGRIVLVTREGHRHRVGLRGLRDRDRARIVAWFEGSVRA
jgi:hypothetical protein